MQETRGSLLLHFFIFFGLFLGSGVRAEVKKEVEVILGIDKVEKLNFAPSTKIQVGSESILNYQLIPQKREISFKGMRPGKTSVILRNTVGDIKARYIITVIENDQSKVVKELKEFLGDIEGIEIGIKGKKVYVGGDLVVPDKIGLINTVLQKYEDVLPLVELSEQTQRIVAQKMQSEIQKTGMRNITVRIVNKVYWIEGVVDSSSKKTMAQKIAEAYLPDRLISLAEKTQGIQTVRGRAAIQNFVVINEKKKKPEVPKMLKITTQFVELTKDYGRSFGMKWTPTLDANAGSISFGKTESGGVATNSSGTLSGTIANLLPKLSTAKAAGHARIIQSGVVVTKNGKKATVQKNTQRKFSLGSGEFTRQVDSNAGFDIAIRPDIIGNEKINLEVSVVVSSFGGSTQETLSNKINTEVIVQNKESAVVGGVVINKTKTDYDRLNPSEGGEPLFAFIRSKSYERERSQFVVFITPEIVQNASDGAEGIKKKFRRRFN